jgi:hypothetical protein
LHDILRRRGKRTVAFSVNMPPRNPRDFDSRRSEVWWAAREELEAGLWDLDAADEELAAQLTAPRWHVDGRGRIHVETKDELGKRGDQFAGPGGRGDHGAVWSSSDRRWRGVPSRRGRGEDDEWCRVHYWRSTEEASVSDDRCTCPPDTGEVLGTRIPCVVHPERERRVEELLAGVELRPRVATTPDFAAQFVRDVRR